MSGPQFDETTRPGREEHTAIVVRANIGGCLVITVARVHADGTVQTRDDRFAGVEAWLDSLTPEDVGHFPYITFEGPDLEPYDWVIERITRLRRQWNGNDFPGPFIESPGDSPVARMSPADGPA